MAAPRPHAPIHAFAKFRHIRFKYVTTIKLAAAAQGGFTTHTFHPDFVNRPDRLFTLGSTLTGTVSVSHQPHAFDFWQAIYQHVAVKRCTIKVDRVDDTAGQNNSGLIGVKLLNAHQLGEIAGVSTNSASTPRSATQVAAVSDRLIETGVIRGGRIFPNDGQGVRTTQYRRWDFRKWNGPRKSLTDAYTLTSHTVYKVPFASTVGGLAGTEFYNQPVFMVYMMAHDTESIPADQRCRVTLWYDVIMKLGDNPDLPSGIAV